MAFFVLNSAKLGASRDLYREWIFIAS